MRIDLDIDLLRTLIAFADTGSFKGASQLILRTQPTVSTQMKRLEEIVGAKLFVKQGRDLAFTQAGSRFALQARQIMALHDKVAAEWRAMPAGGTIRLGLPDDYAPAIVPRILEAIAAQSGAISLTVTSDTSPALSRLLGEGRLDLAVVATPSPLQGDVVLQRDRIVWVTSPRHKAHKRCPLSLALFSDESPVCRATLAALHTFFTPGIGEPFSFRVDVVSNSCAVLASVARHGAAVTSMARGAVPEDLRILTEDDGFPDLGLLALVLRATADSQSIATSHLAQAIVDRFRARVGGR